MVMCREHRTDERYEDFGHVEAESICALPGVLDDISVGGCKVRFPVPVAIDMENQYNLTIRLSQSDSSPLHLICCPQWVSLKGSETVIGFSVLRSPDSPRLESYISEKQMTEGDGDSIYSLIINNEPVFVN